MEDLLYLVSDWTLGDWLLLALWLCVFWGVVRFFLRPRIRCHTTFRHPFNFSWSGKTCDIRRSSKTTS